MDKYWNNTEEVKEEKLNDQMENYWKKNEDENTESKI